MFKTSQPRLSLMTVAIAAAFFASPAFAAPVLGATSAATANSIAATPGTVSLAGYESSFSQINNAGGNGSANSFANSYGAYAVRSNASGIASGAAHAQLTYTLLNSSAVAQSYSMSFHVYGGSISTGLNTFNGNTATLTSGESLSAQYAASVKVNNVQKFSSTASILRTATSIVSSKTGTNLNSGDDGSDGFYSWGGGYFNIDLGVLGVGESMSILAELDDSTLANVGTYDFGTGSGGYGGYGGSCGDNQPTSTLGDEQSNATVGNLICFKGEAKAFYGDPTEFFSTGPTTGVGGPQTTFGSTPLGNDVPEPASLPLAVLALAGAAAATRRRKPGKV